MVIYLTSGCDSLLKHCRLCHFSRIGHQKLINHVNYKFSKVNRKYLKFSLWPLAMQYLLQLVNVSG